MRNAKTRLLSSTTSSPTSGNTSSTKHFPVSELKSVPRNYRTNLINSLTGFKSSSLISTVSDSGIPNVAIFSNIFHIGADPSLIGFINRPIGNAPHTLTNIKATGKYNINSIHTSFVDEAHQTSARYPEAVDEFDAVGLTKQYIDGIQAPFVKESKIQYSLEVKEIVPIEINNTFMVIGEVKEIFVDEKLLSEDGFLNLEEANTVCSLGIDGYYEPKRLKRLSYAKTDAPLSKL